MNKIILIGSVGRDPETRTTSAGINVCSFSLAVNEKRGQEKVTTWFRISAWRKLGEICQQYLTKGSRLCVTGSVSVSTYDGKDGKTRANLEVNADNVEFLSTKAEDGSHAGSAGQEARYASGFTQVDEDSLPF